jgi:hypothetical protein
MLSIAASIVPPNFSALIPTAGCPHCEIPMGPTARWFFGSQEQFCIGALRMTGPQEGR